MPDPSPKTPKTFLALDLGNTNLGCAVFQGERLAHRLIVPVVDITARPEAWLASFPAQILSTVDVSLLSSVNPPAADLVLASLSRVLGKSPLLLGSDVPVPVKARVDYPDEVGTDRLLNVLAAFRRCSHACFIVDLGTALTIDVCDPDGAYLGGIIAPGLGVSASALHDHTALLPKVHVARPKAVTGRNTLDCIRSGLFWGSVSMIEGLVLRLRTEHPEARKVFATGGGAALIASACPVIDEVLPDLHFEGLRIAAQSAGLLS